MLFSLIQNIFGLHQFYFLTLLYMNYPFLNNLQLSCLLLQLFQLLLVKLLHLKKIHVLLNVTFTFSESRYSEYKTLYVVSNSSVISTTSSIVATSNTFFLVRLTKLVIGKYAIFFDSTKEGYTFLGWYNGDELFDFNQKVTSDIQLVAKWEKIKKNNCNGNAIILRYVAILICLSMSIVVIKKHAFR